MFPKACSTEHWSHALLHEWKIIWYNKHMKHCIKHLLLEMFDRITILRHMVTLTAKKLLLLFFIIAITIIKLCFNALFLKYLFQWNHLICGIHGTVHLKKYIRLNSFRTDYIVVRKHALSDVECFCLEIFFWVYNMFNFCRYSICTWEECLFPLCWMLGRMYISPMLNAFELGLLTRVEQILYTCTNVSAFLAYQ